MKNNADSKNIAIRPSEEHPGYWSIDGVTTLLVGGTREDNLFQIDDLESHLDALAAAGGNYIRNTMSDRDEGNVYAFAKIEDGPDAGKYDLERWNPEYWRRFTHLLDLCRDRSIVVQIEVWDRFDISREPYEIHPWNPANNVNYDTAASGLATAYAEHPSRNLQPFFHTIPEMDDNTLLRRYQERYVEKLLSISLHYPNVLYCMNNETHESPAWGKYWLSFIRAQAEKAGVEIMATDMFDGPWESGIPDVVRAQFADPATYPFIDVSQINAWRCTTVRHRENLRTLIELNRDPVRPLNCTKVYNSDTLHTYDNTAARHTDLDGLTAFWIDVLGGFASARFHRPPHGLGQSEKAINSIRSVRLIEQDVRFWDLSFVPDWTGGRSPDEAFLSHAEGTANLVLLPKGGVFTPDAPIATGRHTVRFLDVVSAKWQPAREVDLERTTSIEAPDGGIWIAMLMPVR